MLACAARAFAFTSYSLCLQGLVHLIKVQPGASPRLHHRVDPGSKSLKVDQGLQASFHLSDAIGERFVGRFDQQATKDAVHRRFQRGGEVSPLALIGQVLAPLPLRDMGAGNGLAFLAHEAPPQFGLGEAELLAALADTVADLGAHVIGCRAVAACVHAGRVAPIDLL